MKWVTTNYKGEKVVWYSGDVIKKIKKIALKACLSCGECKYKLKPNPRCDYNKILEIIEKEEK